MDPKQITAEQRRALIRTRIAEKMRDPSGEAITEDEAHEHMNVDPPGPGVYATLRGYGLVEGMPLRLTDLGRQALAAARLDADRTAEPRTKLVRKHPEGMVVGPQHGATHIEDEDGKQTPLSGK